MYILSNQPSIYLAISPYMYVEWMYINNWIWLNMKYLFPLFGWLFISSSFNQKKTMDQYSSVPPSTQTLLSQMLECEFIYTLIYLIPIQLHLFSYIHVIMLCWWYWLLCSALLPAMLCYITALYDMEWLTMLSTLLQHIHIFFMLKSIQLCI